ncbi:MAG: insulinase family protein, partial [Fusobacteriaceae bacterium]
FISPKDSYHLFEKLKIGVTPKEIQRIAQNFYSKNFALLVSLPEKEGISPVDSNTLEKIILDVRNSPGKNLFSENKNNFKAVELKPGKILQENILPEYTHFQLSNGIEVLYKETDFDRDRINMLLFREEGSSVLDYTGYVNSLFLGELLQKSGLGGLNKEEYELFLKGKNFSLSAYISDYDQGFNIYSDRENLDLAMSSLTTLLLEKKLDSDILENRLSLSMEKWRNLKNSPKLVFSEKMKAVLSGDNPRRRTPDEKNLSLVSIENIEAVSNKLFSDFSGYKLIVTGSVDSDTMKNILTKYISALPGSLEKKENFSRGDLGIKQPLKAVRESMSQGEDAKASVSIIYPYQDIYSNKNRILFSAYSKILDIVLIDKIREEMGGVYSIRSSDSLRYENHGENSLTINYSSNPESALKISQAVQDIIGESLKGKYIQENLEKIYENYRLTYEDEIQRNRFWFYYLKNRALKNRDYSVLTPEEYRKFVTYESLLEFLSKALSTDIFIEGLLLPETGKAP